MKYIVELQHQNNENHFIKVSANDESAAVQNAFIRAEEIDGFEKFKLKGLYIELKKRAHSSKDRTRVF